MVCKNKSTWKNGASINYGKWLDLWICNLKIILETQLFKILVEIYLQFLKIKLKTFIILYQRLNLQELLKKNRLLSQHKISQISCINLVNAQVVVSMKTHWLKWLMVHLNLLKILKNLTWLLLKMVKLK